MTDQNPTYAAPTTGEPELKARRVEACPDRLAGLRPDHPQKIFSKYIFFLARSTLTYYLWLRIFNMIKQNPTYAAHPQPSNVTDGRDYSHSNLSKAQLDLAKPKGQIGEVYLFDSTYTLIDSTCIGDLVEYEYKFTGLSNGTYYVKVKVVHNEYCPYSLSLTPLEQDDSTEVVISGSNGNANLYADIECFTRTSCE